ncbi:hypothetical protein OBBRIDRAFT_825253 [Obba rivulosa]|uniref:Uncharacterized protein n=1 Tax=Obba rivulosa TaxID=1052685 RepID=A0A8E2AVV2_9APHY|nr:hypothetical protein OBBRIDRAFT_825253 [Obba rivulosa]
MLFTSLDNVRKPLHKRRKLATDSHCPSDAHTRLPLSPLAADTRPPSTRGTICSSCHRTFHARAGHLAHCARCKAPICSICSRTCTGSVPSIPPTPALTFSPTPPATPLPSPRRVALALHTNISHATGATPRGRRRKARDDDDEEQQERADASADTDASAGRRRKDGILPGCERVICKNCCFENPQSDLTTCYDCYGLPYRVPDQDQERLTVPFSEL